MSKRIALPFACDYIPLNLLPLKLTLTPVLIAAATWIGRRYGPRMAGLFGSLPLTSGPIAVFFYIENGADFAKQAALATFAGIIAVALFSFTYAKLCARHSWQTTLAAAFAVFFAALFLLQRLTLPFALILPLVIAAILLLGRLMRPTQAPTKKQKPSPAWDLPARMIVATALVFWLTAVSQRLGPSWSGLLTPFPIFTSTMAVFNHINDGPGSAIHLLHGLVFGMLGFAAFFAAIYLILPSPLAYPLAVALSLATNFTLSRLR